VNRWVVAAVALAGCAAEANNPPVLWLGLDGSETRTVLIDHAPPRFEHRVWEPVAPKRQPTI
jgi:hypothetical protein